MTGFVYDLYTRRTRLDCSAVKGDVDIKNEINNIAFHLSMVRAGRVNRYYMMIDLAGVTFYAYYPYQPEMTGKTDLIGDDFFCSFGSRLGIDNRTK